MANKKITDLTPNAVLADTDIMWKDTAGSAASHQITGLELKEILSKQAFGQALSDLTTDLTAITDIDDFTFPYDFEVVLIFTTTKTAPTGSTLITDVNLTGTGTILSAKISQDVGEISSLTAAVPPVLSTTTFDEGDQLTYDRDQVGSSVAGLNHKIFIVGYPR
jgi:hypothetical protein